MTTRRSASRVDAAQLLSVAGDLLDREGSRALTARRIAEEAGTSTMAIYSRFGGTGALHSSLRDEGFSRLSAATDTAIHGLSDTVTALAAGAFAYLDFAVANPQLYRFMFVEPTPADDPDRAGSAGGRDAFAQITAALRACADAGRIEPDDPTELTLWAAEVWAMQHGIATMVLTDTIPAELATRVMADALGRLCVGFGDRRDRARRSITKADPTPR